MAFLQQYCFGALRPMMSLEVKLKRTCGTEFTGYTVKSLLHSM